MEQDRVRTRLLFQSETLPPLDLGPSTLLIVSKVNKHASETLFVRCTSHDPAELVQLFLGDSGERRWRTLIL